MPRREPQTSDEFAGLSPGLQWQWQSNPDPSWGSIVGGALRSAGRAGHGRRATPSGPPATCYCRSCRLPTFVATTLVHPESLREGEEAGLVVMGRDYAALTVSPREGGARLALRVCPNADASGTETEAAARAVGAGPVELRVEVGEGAICRFSARSGAGAFEPIGDRFTAREGRWIGAKVGVFARAPHGAATTGSAAFDWFRVGAPSPPAIPAVR